MNKNIFLNEFELMMPGLPGHCQIVDKEPEPRIVASHYHKDTPLSIDVNFAVLPTGFFTSLYPTYKLFS